MTRSISKTLVLIGAVLLASSRLYYVQEMLAALILFAVLFSCMAAALLMLYVLDRAGEAAIALVEYGAKHVLRHALNWKLFSSSAPALKLSEVGRGK